MHILTLADARAIGSNIYYTGNPCVHGHNTYRYVKDRICAACAKLKSKRLATLGGGNKRRWAKKTSEQKEKINAKRREYYNRTRAARLEERKRSYAKLMSSTEGRITRRAYSKSYRAIVGRSGEKQYPEIKRRYRMSYKGRAKRSADEVARRVGIKQAIPKWADLTTIGDVYMEAAYMQKQVDHIVPIRNKMVCGLHVWDNLQLLDAVDNNKKGNRHWPDMPV